MIWIKLPHVSSNTAVITFPRSVGGCTNRTPLATRRSYSAPISLTAKELLGIPSFTSALTNGRTAGWASGSSSNSVPSGSSSDTTVIQACSPTGMLCFTTETKGFCVKPKCLLLVVYEDTGYVDPHF